MATVRDLLTGDVKTEKGRCKRSSAEIEPPYMSELKIVLLGKSGELKGKVGNIILGSEVLSVGDQCERARGLVNGRPVALINTPDLLDPELPDRKLFYQIERCVTLSAPGPHAFLLVLEKVGFTEDDRRRLERILHSFSDEAFKYSVVLLIQASKKNLVILLVELCKSVVEGVAN
ncbi:GTPase IMAP family member 4-like [Anguilla rostrata]|uniref:GTPase IMAP family member 4-like n=1 Tax=Anguilla rostrata TaxID=7938 RepID=UPI0030D07BC9